MAESKITRNHDEIRKWVAARGGHPARVKGTDLLRIDYPAYSGEDTLEPISWEEFFDTFDASKLAFLYQEKLDSGEISRFSKLIDRHSAEAKAA